MPIEICVDDYGMSEGIDASTHYLVRNQICTNVSALVVSPRWKRTAKIFESECGRIAKRGLHFCLTGSGFSPQSKLSLRSGLVDERGSFLPAWQLFVRACRGDIDQEAVAAEFQAQLEKFESQWGSPDHIDSHHHIHQWPGIDDVILKQISQLKYSPILRCTTGFQTFDLGAKRRWLSFWGKAFQKKSQALGLTTNDRFATIFSGSKMDLRSYVLEFERAVRLARTQELSLLWLVHPALFVDGIESYDSYQVGRVLEHHILSSEYFLGHLSKWKLSVRDDRVTQ